MTDFDVEKAVAKVAETGSFSVPNQKDWALPSEVWYYTAFQLAKEELDERSQFERENDGATYELRDLSSHPYWRKQMDETIVDGYRYEGFDSLEEVRDAIAKELRK